MSALLAVLSAVSLLAKGEIATVGATSITREAFAQRMEALRGRERTPSADEVLNSLFDEAVLAEEGRRLGLEKDPAVAARIAGERRSVVTDALVRDAAAAMKPTEEELRAGYHATTDFARVQVYRYASADEASAGATRLRAGADPLAEAKRSRSAQIAARDIDAPYVMRAQLDADVATAVFRARPGEVAGPVKSGNDWVVAKILVLEVGDDAGFQQARPSLFARAQARGAEAARQHLVSTARARTKPDVDEAFLATAAPKLDATAAELEHVVARVGAERILFSEVVAIIRNLAQTGAGAHATAPETRRQVVQALVDSRLLFSVARERGIESRPDVQSQMALVERGVLASAALQRVFESAAGARDDRARAELVRARVDELRRKSNTTVDRAALAQAAAGGR